MANGTQWQYTSLKVLYFFKFLFLVFGIVKTLHESGIVTVPSKNWYWVLGIVKASLKILGIGIGINRVVLLRSGAQNRKTNGKAIRSKLLS